ncbi:TRAP transporter large permease [Mesobacillus harenae]|uniref:TRAP transporter large permease n=1 Tax=Mesobacillus harenae TaxID=2213203 RepID=UPI0015806F49|nr:TRAP transporter large permease [Mesobacillus harenae]
MMLILFIVVLLLLIFMRVPVAFSLGISSLILMFIESGFAMNYDLISQRMFYGLNSFVLLAVPFFILAGKLMNAGGITDRIFNFADSLVGHMPGGLGHANVVASLIFSGMSGSATADAAGLGAIEVKAMKDKGFDEKFAVGITAASSTVGPIIPPSIPLIMFGVIGGVSVGQLFMAGVIPGILIGVTFMIMVYYFGVKRNYPKSNGFSINYAINTFIPAVFPLLTPVIILSGIFTGWFTPTEASVIAVVYAFILGVCFYREIRIKDIPKVLFETGKETASLTFIVATASLFGYVLVLFRIPQMVAESITTFTTNPILILFMIAAILFLVGFFMETVTAIIIFTPLFMPVVTQLGIDPIQLGIVMVVTLMIGVITPPVGMVLFVMTRVSNLSMEKVCQAVIPFFIPLIVVIILLIIFPQISTFLPKFAQ